MLGWTWGVRRLGAGSPGPGLLTARSPRPRTAHCLQGPGSLIAGPGLLTAHRAQAYSLPTRPGLGSLTACRPRPAHWPRATARAGCSRAGTCLSQCDSTMCPSPHAVCFLPKWLQ